MSVGWGKKLIKSDQATYSYGARELETGRVHRKAGEDFQERVETEYHNPLTESLAGRSAFYNDSERAAEPFDALNVRSFR